MKIAALLIGIIFSMNGFSQCYNVIPVTYNPYPDTGTVVSLIIDDKYSDSIQIGFPFCFYGDAYTSLVIGSNGIVSFNKAYANGFCPWRIEIAIPHLSLPINAIMFPWVDLFFPVGGQVCYALHGMVPNRSFVISFDSVPYFTPTICQGNFLTSQLILFETTNNIEVHINYKPPCVSWNQGRAIEGIQNKTGTMGVAVPGRNCPLLWFTTNDAWRFETICDVCTPIGINEIPSGEFFSLFPNPATNEIRIESGKFKVERIEMCNMMGEKVKDLPLNSLKGTSASIDVSKLIPGIYFVTVTDEAGNKAVRKVVKM
ncbi:MAG TPA: T9SS type A sorting domain-containing protein [Bacteroidia bacterium]|nr:T9SS type A sorting domain-containing protein [Bacteroidia bacterium]